MATNAIAIEPAIAGSRPYAPSWIDLLLRWIHGLPWPAPVTYLALAILGIIVANNQNWMSGAPVGSLTIAQTFWGIFTIAFLAAIDYLNGVAGDAFDAFRPALSSGVVDEVRARYELTTISARMGLVILALSFPFTGLYYVSDPVASQIVGLPPAALALRWVFEAVFSALLLCTIAHAFRQLQLVSRLHAVADRLDPFHPAPLYAFSRLTAQTGGALVAAISLGMLANSDAAKSSAFVTLWVPWLVIFIGGAVVIFVAPLLGMHRRLATVKMELQGAAEDRLKIVLAELNADVDARDLSRADGLQKTLGSLVQQRDILAKLPTWPWSAGTLRGFGSALLLPLAIFLLQRAALAILGA